MNNKVRIFILIPLLTLLAPSILLAQKRILMGVNINENIYPDQIELNRLNIGATFEIQMSRHSGGETGLFYHANSTTGIISYPDATGPHSYSFTVSNRYLTVPVLYKYYTKFIDFSVGPTIDFYVGWKQKHDEFPYQIQSNTVNPKMRVGFLAKVSKDFSLSQRFVIEPEIRFSSVHAFDEANLGIGITVKYRFWQDE